MPPNTNPAVGIGDVLRSAQAVLSVYFAEFEIVVVDDGSRDRTANKVQERVRPDSPIRLLRHSQNCGYGSAVTTGLRKARGDLEPLAFRQTQVHWQERRIPHSFSTIVGDFLTFEPIRGDYRPECECFWANDPPRDSAALSMQFMNPIYVLLTAGLIALGWRRGWLNRKEVLLSVLLVLMAYVLQRYRTCMSSQARYVSVAFPQFMVLGHLLARLPTWLCVFLIVGSAAVMAMHAAMFTSGYWYY